MNSLFGLAIALHAYGMTRWRHWRLRSRSGVLSLQQRNLRRFLRGTLPQVDYYADWRGRSPSLADLPVVDKAVVMAAFHRFNRPGIGAEAGWRAFAGSRRIGSYHVGASTGTSGNRGLFVISERERFRWLGTILAKALPGFWRRKNRIAVILPQTTALYEAANDTGLLQLRFFDLRLGPEAWAPALQDFAPTMIVAPPRVLVWLADHAPRLAPSQLYAGAETLDPPDRARIEARFGVTLGQIYLATEGLLGVSCPHGALHLAEDGMHFEFLPAGEGLVTPLITDTVRQTQVMARYRMNDLLRLSEQPCPCGSPLQVVTEIVGRSDDCFHFRLEEGEIIVTPDILRNAILDSDRRIEDFRLRMKEGEIVLQVSSALAPSAADAAKEAVESVLRARGVPKAVRCEQVALAFDASRKLRRVEVCR